LREERKTGENREEREREREREVLEIRPRSTFEEKRDIKHREQGIN